MYGADWYFRFGPYEFIGVMSLIGLTYYLLVQRHKGDAILDSHRAVEAEFPAMMGDVAP